MRLRISKWAEVYENFAVEAANTLHARDKRPKKSLRYIQWPLVDGIGKKMLEMHPEGNAYTGVWIKLCETTARLDCDKRGLLIRGNGEAYTVEDLYILHQGGDLKQWERAIAFFLQPKPGWLIDEDAKVAPTVKEILTVAPPEEKPRMIYSTEAISVDEFNRIDPIYAAARKAASQMTARHIADKSHSEDYMTEALVQFFHDSVDPIGSINHVAAKHAEMCGKRHKDGGWKGREVNFWPKLWEWIKTPEALAPLPEVKPDTSTQDAERLRAEMEQAWAALTVAERQRLLIEAKLQWSNHVQFDEDFALSMAKQEAWRRANEYAA